MTMIASIVLLKARIRQVFFARRKTCQLVQLDRYSDPSRQLITALLFTHIDTQIHAFMLHGREKIFELSKIISLHQVLSELNN